MRESQQTRRTFVRLLMGGVACGSVAFTGMAAAQSCFDLAKLPVADRGLRKSMNFIAVSTDPQKTCGSCAFFTATQPASCGTCAMLSGGAVAADSVCDSWVAKQ